MSALSPVRPKPVEPVSTADATRAALRVSATLCAVMLVTAVAAAIVVTAPDAFGDGFWDHRTRAAAASALKGLSVLGACGTIGTLVVSVLLLQAGDPGALSARSRVTRAAAPWAALWCLGAVGSAIVLLSRADSADAFVWSLRCLVGTAWASGVVGVLVQGRPSPTTGCAALGLAVVAVLLSVVGGHAWHAEARVVTVVSLVVHVLAVTAWVGGLLALALHVPRGGRGDVALLHRFSSLAVVCFALVAGSGVVNALSRLSWSELLDSGAYGVLLGVKVALFVLVGAAGLVHRRRTLTRLEGGAAGSFWTLVAGELVVLTTVVGLGAALAGAGPAHGGPDEDVHAAVRI